MSVILTKYKGESTTFGFVIPDSYDLANMQDVKVYVGSKVYSHVMDNVRTVKAKLTSEDTQALQGRNSVIFHIDDAVFGIRKILVGEFQVDNTVDNFRDESVNLGYDVLVMLKVEIDTIEVDSILYNIAKGDSAFTAWQKLPENVGKDWNDYIAYLREPMTEAIEQGNETAAEWAIVEAERVANELIREQNEEDRNAAEVIRKQVKDATIAAKNEAIQATIDANNAGAYARIQGDYANEKGNLADAKAEEARLATIAANDAASIANTAKGWTPLFTDEADGPRIIRKLSDYFGGTGTKPTTNVGLYLKSDGTYTATKAQAMDYKGVAGEVTTLQLTNAKNLTITDYKKKILGKNRFNPNDPNNSPSSYITANGAIASTIFMWVSGFIPIALGETLYFNSASTVNGQLHALYDINFNLITTVNASVANRMLTATQNGYARFCTSSPTPNTSTFQIELGTGATSFEPYRDILISESNLDSVLLAKVNSPFPSTLIPNYNAAIWSDVHGGSTRVGNIMTIPSANTTASYFGATASSVYNGIADIASLVGKKIRIIFKFKKGGNTSNLLIGQLTAYFGGLPENLSNRVSSTDGDIITRSAEWLVTNPSSGGQFYIGLSQSVAAPTDSTVEYLGVYYSIISGETIEPMYIKGLNLYIIDKLFSIYNPSAVSEGKTLSLPSIIPVAKGRELNIYKKNIREQSDLMDENIPLTMLTIAGADKGERFQYAKHPTAVNANTILTTKQYNSNLILLRTDTFTLKDVSNNNKLGAKSRLNVLAIGDSISEQGWYELELMNLFTNAATNGGSSIRYFGTRNNSASNWEIGMTNQNSIVLPLKTECRGGWWTTNYLQAARTVGNSMDAPNPFWNAGYSGGADVDFLNYVSNLNAAAYSGDAIDTIDIFSITLGTNDLVVLTQEQFIANMNTLINKMWRDYPNCIIIINTIPPGSLNKDDASKIKIINWNSKLISEFQTPKQSPSGTGRSYLSPIHFWVDRSRGYGEPKTTRLVGESALMSGHSSGWYDGTHPYILGHLQMADAIFSGYQNAIELHNIYLASL